VHYFFQSHIYWSHLQKAQGSTLKNINLPLLKSLVIPLPPLPEQQKIAEILSTVDKAIEKADEAIEKTQRLKKGLMHELLTGRWQTVDSKQGKREFKDTEIGRIPKEWDVVQLSQVVEKIKRGPFGGSIKKEIFIPKGYKVYEQKNVINNDFKLGTYYISEKKYYELKSFAIQEGDILLTAAGTIGKLAIIPRNAKPGIINQALIKITLDKKKVIIHYFFNFFEFAPFRKRVLGSSHGATMKNISSVKNLKSLKIPLPPLPEQQKIAEILSTVDVRLAILRKRKEKLERIKRGLMNDLLTGKKRVKVKVDGKR